MSQIKARTGACGAHDVVSVVEGAPPPLGAYSPAVIAGDFVFVSGQGARKAKTGKEAGVVIDHTGAVVAYDIQVQTRTVLENLKLVLAAADCGLQDVVDVSVFLKNIEDFAAYNSIYGEYFSGAKPPARTTVQVTGLPGKNYIEIKATAYRPGGKER